MNINELVQVDDHAWIEPKTVSRVKHWSYAIENHTYKNNTVITHDDGRVTISYWPFDRIQRVLGLVDKTWIHDAWER